ncbi:MAG: molybdopterin molybdotransferase MoeA [Clostridia bacterium]|nr:molybdopterin molybdotransferase MoeA [Clostridia bacterium]
MLKVVSSEDALNMVKTQFDFLKAEKENVSISNCLGRILFEDIFSVENIPAFNRSTVDGYALRASNTFGSSESSPAQLRVIGEVLMGEKTEIELYEDECVKISTGGMLPSGADSVVMVENTDCSFLEYCLVQKAVSPFENVTKKGDDIKEKDIVLKKGKIITSREIGILAALGINRISVAKKIKVGIISTGDEIVPIDSEKQFGQIRDINTHILSSLVKELGCDSTEYGIIKDDYDSILTALKTAVNENDIVLISGGSSAGIRDMTADIISSLGEVYFHGIAIKPGKPTILGKAQNTVVFGLPGHPMAAYFVTLKFVKPLIDSILCKESTERLFNGQLTQNISSNHGREEIVCVKISGDKVQPYFGKSGVISLLSKSDGYIIIDRNLEGLRQGDEVQVFLF